MPSDLIENIYRAVCKIALAQPGVMLEANEPGPDATEADVEAFEKAKETNEQTEKDNAAQAAANPALEKIRSDGFEVLYVSEPIDEMTLQNIDKFNEKQITDVGKEQSDLSDDEKKEKDEANETYESVRLWIKKVLGDRITKVEVSTRLVDSPATLVQSEYGVSPNMQKYLRAQAVVENDDKGEFANIFNQAVLEINPTHPIIKSLKEAQEQDEENEEAKEAVELVFNTAALAAGYALENAADYAKLVTSMMTKLSAK